MSGAVDARVGAGLLGVDIGQVLSIVNAYVCAGPLTLSMPYPGFFGPILSFFITALRHCPHSFVFIRTSNWGGPLYCITDVSIIHTKKIILASFARST